MSKPILRAVIAGLTLTCAAPAMAEEAPAPYGDLDLNTDDGARVMLHRIREAAIEVCGGRHDLERILARRSQLRACIEGAVDAAVADLEAPRVTAMHELGQPSSRRVARRADPQG